MLKKLFGSKRRATVTAVILALVLAAAAYAAWTFSARSGASAKAQTLAAPSVEPAANPSATLVAGGTVPVEVDVTNPNSVAMKLVSITVTNVSPTAIVSSDPTACPASNLTIGFSAQAGLSVNVPASATTKIALTGQTLSMNASAPIGCMGKTFTLSSGAGQGWDLNFEPA